MAQTKILLFVLLFVSFLGGRATGYFENEIHSDGRTFVRRWLHRRCLASERGTN